MSEKMWCACGTIENVGTVSKAPSGRGLPSGSEAGGENLRLLFSPSPYGGVGAPRPTERKGDGAVEAKMDATAA